MFKAHEFWTIESTDDETKISWRYEEYEDNKLIEVREDSITRDNNYEHLMIARLSNILCSTMNVISNNITKESRKIIIENNLSS